MSSYVIANQGTCDNIYITYKSMTNHHGKCLDGLDPLTTDRTSCLNAAYI